MSTTWRQTKVPKTATIKPMAHVKKPPTTKLAKLMEAKGVSQAELARRTETSRQQVGKYYKGKFEMSARWAKRFAGALGVEWTSLLSEEFSSESATGVEHRMTVRELNPKPGDPIYDLDEAAIIGMWRKLTITKKAALFHRLGFDEMPTLAKAN